MSGARGGSQQFAIRLALDGAEAVESGMRRVQATAVQVGQEVSRTGDSTGRALAVIERGAQAAGTGLQKLGGDFAALAPVVENAGGAIGRVVLALSSGGGLLGVLGAVGGAVAAAVALYQNWSTVTSALGTAIDTLTGRVRANGQAIAGVNDLLRDYLRLSESAAQAGVRRQVEQQSEFGARAQARIAELNPNIADLEASLARARAGGGGGATVRRGGASGLVPTDDFARGLDQQVIDRARTRQQAEIQRIEGELRLARARRDEAQGVLDRTRGVTAALGEAAGSVLNPPPPEPTPARSGRGGGGGARPAAPSSNDLLSRRDAFAAANDPFERYAQTLARIGQLQADLDAAGQSPLPDEAVIRATNQAMEQYERATEAAARSTATLADSSKDLERAGGAAAKALAGAFEELVFEGRSFDDVLKNLERSLLRIGNQYLLQPLFQQGLGALFGTPGANGSAGAGGLIGQGVSAIGSLFTASVAHDGALVGAGGGPARMVPMSLFANAPRFHAGGIIGPDERPIIAQTGERVLNRREAAAYARGGGMTININTPDAGSFRNSEGQIMSKLAAAIARTGRNR